MKKLLPVLFLLSTYLCHAQNYQCLQSGVKHYFTNGNHYLRGIRIDSVRTIGSVTAYYPYKTKRSYPTYGIAGSWLGNKVLQLTDGTFLFDDIRGDTVTIKTQAHPGDTWLFYSDTTTTKYTATVITEDTMTILGTIDSVKKITINSYPVDLLNNFKIVLGKNTGFVQVFDLYTFPYTAPAGYILWSTDFYLYNLLQYYSYPDSNNSEFTITQYHDPTQLEVYNFNVGDAFISNNISSGIPNAWNTHWDNHLDSIISKTYIDSYHVQYTIAHGEIGETDIHECSGMLISSSPYPYSCCSLYVFNADSSVLYRQLKMPEEAGNDSLYYYNPADDTLCFLSASYTPQYMPYNGTFESCPVVTIFKDGFLPFYNLNCNCYSCNPGEPQTCQSTTSLYFASKSTLPCSTHHVPLSPTNIPVVKDKFTLFPNPASTQLTIQSTNEPINEVIITNILGQVVYHESTTPRPLLKTGGEVLPIDISGWPGGVYFVKVNGASTSLSMTRKFVKE